MDTKSIDILKTAILMERRGAAFYGTVAEQTQFEEVRKIFTMMAEEEKLHIKYLSDLYLNYTKGQAFEKFPHAEPQREFLTLFFLKKLKNVFQLQVTRLQPSLLLLTWKQRQIEVYSRES